MDENKDQPQTPDFSNEEMKMPESAIVQSARQKEPSIINGPLLIILALLLVLILGGMYYWFGSLNATTPAPVPTRPTAEQNNEPESTTAEAQVQTTQAVSTSDEISAIEADLEATNLDSLDAGINDIEAELDAAVSAQ